MASIADVRLLHGTGWLSRNPKKPKDLRAFQAVSSSLKQLPQSLEEEIGAPEDASTASSGTCGTWVAIRWLEREPGGQGCSYISKKKMLFYEPHAN